MSQNKQLVEKIRSYSDLIDNTKLALLLNVPESSMKKDIAITDINDEYDFVLASFHYRNDRLEEMKEYYSHVDYMAILQIRGVIVNLREMRVVCKSYPSTKNINIESLPESSNIEESILNPSEYLKEVFTLSKKFNKYIVGTVLRVFVEGGIVFISTHRKISFDNSRFGSDKTFKQMFFEAQDCFRVADEIPISEGTVHFFMLSSDAVNTDSRQSLEEDRIYYVTSFQILNNNAYVNSEMEEQMKSAISNLNLTSGKKVYFPELIDLNQVNSILNPTNADVSKVDDSKSIYQTFQDISEMDRMQALKKYFQNGEKVIMRTENGDIFSLIPPSSLRRTLMNEGNFNHKKIFYDCIGYFAEGTLYSKKIFVRYGFKLDKLREMKTLLENGQEINFENYPAEDCTFLEVLITNIFFSVPVNRLDEVLSFLKEYEEESVKNFNFILSRKESIKFSLDAKTFQNYPGMHNKKGLVNYFISNYRSYLNSNVVKYEIWWPESIKNRFLENKNKIKNPKVKKLEKESLQKENNLMAFVYNITGTSFYSMMNFSKLVISCEAAWERSSLK